jgi:PASTA domain
MIAGVRGAVLLSLLALAGPAAAQLGVNGAKAYDMAHAADDAARVAEDEGRETLKELQVLRATSRDADALKLLQEQGTATGEALAGFRRQTQANVDETMALLAELMRLGSSVEPARRQQAEQRALLSAYEAAVMAARTRSQAERLRALQAEGRALLAGGGPGASPGGSGAPTAARASRAKPEGTATAANPGDVLVPNVIGARLDFATRELEAIGLKVGPTTGPRDGFVVKQTPAPGTPAPRQAGVSLTLSGTAASVTDLPPR